MTPFLCPSSCSALGTFPWALSRRWQWFGKLSPEDIIRSLAATGGNGISSTSGYGCSFFLHGNCPKVLLSPAHPLSKKLHLSGHWWTGSWHQNLYKLIKTPCHIVLNLLNKLLCTKALSLLILKLVEENAVRAAELDPVTLTLFSPSMTCWSVMKSSSTPCSNSILANIS